MELTGEQRQRFANFGLSDELIERVRIGQEIAFEFRTESAVGVGLLQILDARLRAGILEINDPGGGLLTFVRFRNGAFTLARSLGSSESSYSEWR